MLLLTVEEKLEIRTMSRKVNISVDNLPDTLRGQIHGVESAIDNESLALFTDNKDVRVSIENAAHGLRAYSNTFNHSTYKHIFVDLAISIDKINLSKNLNFL